MDLFPRGKGHASAPEKKKKTKKTKQVVADDGLFGSGAMRKRKTMGGSGGKSMSGSSKSSIGEALSTYWLKERELEIGENLLKKKRIQDPLAMSKQEAPKADTGTEKKKKRKEGIQVEQITTPTVKTVSPGTLMLGLVKRVTRKQMFVALPYGMSGFVSSSEVSDGPLRLRETELNDEDDEEEVQTTADKKDSLERIFREGDTVRCAVVSTTTVKGQKQSVTLTLKPSVVNRGLFLEHLRLNSSMYGAVVAIEDHGYIISFGVEGYTGFLARGEVDTGRKLFVGQPLDLIVTSINKVARTLTVSSLKSKVMQALAAPGDLSSGSALKGASKLALPLRALKPGALVAAIIDRKVHNGLVVTFLGSSVAGVIEQDHLAAHCKTVHWDHLYRPGQAVTARILTADYAGRAFTLTLRPHLLSMKAPSALPAAGEVIEEAVVLRIDTGVGMLLGVPAKLTEEETAASGDQKALIGAYVPIAFAKPEETEEADDDGEKTDSKKRKKSSKKYKLESEYALDDKLRCRIVATNLCEGMCVATVREHEIEASVLSARDLQPAQIHKGPIIAVEKWGVLIDLGHDSRVLVNRNQLADATVQDPKSRFRVGAKVTVRVLTVEKNGRKVYGTMKKSLVTDPHPAITSYDDAAELVAGPVGAKKATGYVSRISAAGLCVTFYNNVYGLIPSNVLSKQGVEDVSNDFSVGQVIKVALHRISKEGKFVKLYLMLDIEGDVDEEAELSSSRPALSTVVSGKVTSNNTSEKKLFLRLVGDYDGQRAVLPYSHLSDLAALGKLEGPLIKPGQEIEGLVVIEDRSDSLIVSQKTLLSAFPLVQSVDGMRVGNAYAGVVKRIETFGVFISFAQSFSALCPSKEITGTFLEDLSKESLLKEGDSIVTTVKRFDTPKTKHVNAKRPVLSVKPSSLPGMGFGQQGSLYLSSLFAQRSRCRRTVAAASEADDIIPDVTKYPLGRCTDATVVSRREDGSLVMRADDGATRMIAPAEHAGKSTGVKIDDVVKVRVLDVDLGDAAVVSGDASTPTQCSLVVSALPSLVKAGRTKRLKQAYESKSCPAVGETVKCRIVHVVDGFGYAAVSVRNEEDSESDLAIMGFLQLSDFHCPYAATKRAEEFTVGTEVEAVVRSMPKSWKAKVNTAESLHSNAILLALKSEESKASDISPESKRQEWVMGSPVSVSDLHSGALVTVRVESIEKDRASIRIRLAPQGSSTDDFKIVRASIHAKALRLSAAADGETNSAFTRAGVIVGKELAAKVLRTRLGKKQTGEGKQGGTLLFVDLAPVMADGDSAEQPGSNPAIAALKVGSSLEAEVKTVKADGCNVTLAESGVEAFVHCLDLSQDIAELRKWRTKPKSEGTRLKPGVRLQVNVVGKNMKLGVVHLSVLFKSKQEVLSKTRVCMVTQASKRLPRVPSLPVQLPGGLMGSVCATELNEPSSWESVKVDEKTGAIVDYVAAESTTKRANISPLVFHPCSIFTNQQTEDGKIPQSLQCTIRETEAIAINETVELPALHSVVQGFIMNTNEKGSFVRFHRNAHAHVLLKDLSDKYVKDPAKEFPPGLLVAGKVCELDEETKHVRISLRPTSVVGDGKTQFIQSIEVGSKFTGHVKRVTDFGVFVALDVSKQLASMGLPRHTEVTGLCHMSEVADKYINDLDRVYKEGDLVRALVIRKDDKRGKLSLSMKASHFKDEEESGSSDDDDEEESDDEAVMDDDDASEDALQAVDGSSDSEADDFMTKLQAQVAAEDSDDDDDVATPPPTLLSKKSKKQAAAAAADDDESDSDSEEDEEHASKRQRRLPGGMFEWEGFSLSGRSSGGQYDDGGSESEDGSESGDSSDDDDDDEESGKKKSKRKSSKQKAKEKEQKEREIRAKERAMLQQADDGPVVDAWAEDDFERELMAAPNDSKLWIRYMAFRLSLADVDAARKVGERALKTINFREEDEKLNVWVALLNLEYKFGNKKSVTDTIRRASSASHPKRIYLRVTEMYESNGDHQAAAEAYTTAIKKFKTSKKVWSAFIRFQLRKGDDEAASNALKRSLKSLSKHKHVFVINRFAQDEYLYGSVERGRTIFEGLLASYPRRVDLWNVYIDKEVKAKEFDFVRQLFERLTTLQLSSKAVKGVFKKWLAFEAGYGDAESLSNVKAKAQEYVKRVLQKS